MTTCAVVSWSETAGAETVPLKREGGVFVVPVTINDTIALDFTLDTGAAEVSIPFDVFSTLNRSGTIRDSDMLDFGTYVLADGSQQRQRRFRIRSMRLGKLELRDVVASVAPPSGALLLGQSFFERLTGWSIDNQRHLLVLNEGVNRQSAAPSNDRPTPRTDDASSESVAPPPAQPSVRDILNYIKVEVGSPGHVDIRRTVAAREAGGSEKTTQIAYTFSFVPSECRADISLSESINSSPPKFLDALVRLNRPARIIVSSEKDAANQRDPTLAVTAVEPEITTITLKSDSAAPYPYLMFRDREIAQTVANSLQNAVTLCGGNRPN